LTQAREFYTSILFPWKVAKAIINESDLYLCT
jgi:hypothetical protein